MLKLFHSVIDDMGVEGISWFKESEHNHSSFFRSISLLLPSLSNKIEKLLSDKSFQESEEEAEELGAQYESLYTNVIDLLIKNEQAFDTILSELEAIFLELIAPHTRAAKE